MTEGKVVTAPRRETKNVDQLLSEKLIQGWVLMQLCCPVCATPLVKTNETSRPAPEKKIPSPSTGPLRATATPAAARVAKEMEEKLRKSSGTIESTPLPAAPSSDDKAPVDGDRVPIASGVPFCVSCEAHVVTDPEMLAVVASAQEEWEGSETNAKGSILIAFSTSDKDPEESDDADLNAMAEEKKFAETGPDAGPETSPRQCEGVWKERGEDEKEGITCADLKCDPEALIVRTALEAVSSPLAQQLMKSAESLVTGGCVDEGALSVDLAGLPTEEGFEFEFNDYEANISSVVEDACSEVTMNPHLPPHLVQQEEREEIPQTIVKEKQYKESLKVTTAYREGYLDEMDNTALSPTTLLSTDASDDRHPDDVLLEYSVRREIATKVLGAKMLQGYTLKETQCLKCGMPLMEHMGQLDCVVCPVLVKQAHKALKDRQDAERERSLEGERLAKEADQARMAEEVRMNEEVRMAKGVRIAEEKRFAQALVDEARSVEDANIAEEARIAEAASMAHVERLTEEALAKDFRLAEEDRLAEEEYLATLAEENRIAKEERIAEEIYLENEAKIVEEKRLMRVAELARLEEESRLIEVARFQEKMRAKREEKRLAEEARLEEEKKLAELARLAEEAWMAKEQADLAEVARFAERARLAEEDRIAEEEMIARQIRLEKMEQETRLAEQRARIAQDARLAEEWRLVEDERLTEESRLAEEEKLAEETRLVEEARIWEEARLVEEERAASEIRLAEEVKLREVARRMKEAEERRLGEEAAIRKAGLKAEEEAQAAHEARLTEEFNLREEARKMKDDKEAEERRLGEEAAIRKAEQKAEEEARAIDAIEAEACMKARAAEDAIALAKAAMAEVAESKAREYKELKKAASDGSDAPIDDNWWDKKRNNSRSAMTKRMLEGWTMLADYCRGSQCKFSPLMSHNGGQKTCLVCGGTGGGHDGAYGEQQRCEPVAAETQNVQHQEETEFEHYDRSSSPQSAITSDLESSQSISISQMEEESKQNAPPKALIPAAKKIETEDDFKARRSAVSREIGRRMLSGWMLLDTPCPFCVMPLMSETKDSPEQCVVCGDIDTLLEDKKAEDALLAEEERLVEEERQLEEDQKAEELARLEEQERLAERARLEEFRLIEKARLKREAQLAEEVRILEETRKAEESRLSDLVRVTKEKKRVEAERLAERKRRDENAKAAESAMRVRESQVAEAARQEAKEAHFSRFSSSGSVRSGYSRMSDDRSCGGDSRVVLNIPENFNFNDESALKDLIQKVRTTGRPPLRSDVTDDKPPSGGMPKSRFSFDRVGLHAGQETGDAIRNAGSKSGGGHAGRMGLPPKPRVEGPPDESVDAVTSVLRKNGGTTGVSTENDRVPSFFGDVRSTSAGERLRNGWTLLHVAPCEECAGPKMAPNNESGAVGQCVNNVCPLSNTLDRASDDLHCDGSTEVEKWSANDDDDDDGEFDSLDNDPEIIKLQMGSVQNRTHLPNNGARQNDAPSSPTGQKPKVQLELNGMLVNEEDCECPDSPMSAGSQMSTMSMGIRDMHIGKSFIVQKDKFDLPSPLSTMSMGIRDTPSNRESSKSQVVGMGMGMGMRDMSRKKAETLGRPRMPPVPRPGSAMRGRPPSMPKPRVRSYSPSPMRAPSPDDFDHGSRASSRRSRRGRRGPPSVVVGGAGIDDEDSALSDDARSVATDALGAILAKIETCKATLMQPSKGGDAASIKEEISQQIEMAELIEKLATAACAMRKMENLGQEDA